LLYASVLFPASAFGQAVTEDWLKSEYTVLLAGYFTWPEEEKIDTFTIGVLSSESVYTQLSLKSEMQEFKQKPFRVIYFNRPGELQPVNILFAGEKRNKSIRKVYNRLAEKPVLLVTDSCMEYEFTMLNLMGMNLAGTKPFRINKNNIDKAGLSVSSKILLVGGSEEDLRDIYHELELEGNKMRTELDTLSRELEGKQRELAESERELAKRSNEIDLLVREIETQTDQLTTLSDSIDLKQMDLVAKIRLLANQEQKIKLRENEINTLNAEISGKEMEIDERSRIIQKQMDDIVLQTAMMKEQQKILDSQKIQIERQKMVLWFFGILSVLILGLGFVIFLAYRIKIRANRILREKNHIIEDQKRNILKQNENITASIYYALTIQQAILPEEDKLKRLFDCFIIYMPKDIVSGDFYWFSRRGRKKTGERSFCFAVVDCTGHGVPGGFLSMIGSRTLDSIVNEQKIEQTDEILELMDKRIRQALNQQKSDNEDGMDVCLCRLTYPGDEVKDDTVYLSFSGARRSLYLIRQGQDAEIIRGVRRTIGGKYFNPTPFLKNELALKKGDRIYLTSDGLTDQHSPQREKFGTGRFINFLNTSSSLGMKEQQSGLEEEIYRFMNPEIQRDDITIMGIKL
jgi:serine phosphatase RsbU (regulator of sigma subunit)